MENNTHIIDNPCICTEGGIIRESGYYFYKEKGKPVKNLIIVEKVLQNDRRKITLRIYFPQADKRIEINHSNTDRAGECKWQIFDGITDEEHDLREQNID